MRARDEERLAADRPRTNAPASRHPAGDRGAAPARISARAHDAEALGDLAGEVGEHEVGAGALDRGEVLERDRVGVDPAELRRRPSPSRTRRSRGTPPPGRRTRPASRRSRRGTRARASPSPCRRPRRRRAPISAMRLTRVRRVHLVAAAVAEAAARTRQRRGTARTAPTRTSPSRRGSPPRRGPAVSRPARIAPTWPSIIPDGAITSAPASAWATAMLGVALERGVVVDGAVGREHPAVAVVGVLVEAVVGDQHEVVADLVAHRAQRCPGRRRRARRRREPRASLRAGTPKRTTPGTPRSARARTSLRRLSSVCCTTPGIEAIGSGASMPSFTKSGATRSSTPTRASATRRRSAAVRRSRRSRCSGNGMRQWYEATTTCVARRRMSR